jgi:hypothetical protein
MVKMRLLIIVIGLLYFSCNYSKPSYDARMDVRFSGKFFSIFFNQYGKAYVVKGIDVDGSGVLKPSHSDTSIVFNSDSIKYSYKALSLIKSKPVIAFKSIGDSPRIEIYHNKKKIYDANTWDESFLTVFRPIMKELPKGYNPFNISEKPFD